MLPLTRAIASSKFFPLLPTVCYHASLRMRCAAAERLLLLRRGGTDYERRGCFCFVLKEKKGTAGQNKHTQHENTRYKKKGWWNTLAVSEVVRALAEQS